MPRGHAGRSKALATNQEIDNPITKKHEVIHTYGWYLKRFIADARAKGATPILCTLIPRKTWEDGKMVRNKADYAGWAAAVAEGGKSRWWI